MTPPPIRPLSELNTVNWKAYRHAYGPASDIPKLLREMAEELPKAAIKALQQLENSIFHQGIAPADEVVLALLPFLLELILHGPAAQRARLLEMLAEMLQSMKDFRAYSWPEGYQPPEWQELERQLLALGPLLLPLLGGEDTALAIAAGQYFNVRAWYKGRPYAGRIAEIEGLANEEVREAVLAHAVEVWGSAPLDDNPLKAKAD